MSVYQRGPDFWGNWTDDAGKRHRWPLGETVRTRRDAERKFIEDVEALRATSRGRQLGLLSLAPSNTVEAALDHVISHPGEVAPATVDGYRKWKPRILKHVPGRTLVGDVTRDTLAALVRGLRDEGVGDHSIEKPLNTLCRALRECLDRRDAAGLRLLDRVPSARGLLKPGRYVPRDRWLTRDEYRRLLVELPPNRRLWLVVAVYTGLHHPSDLGRLDWRDVQIADRRWLRRNQKNRSVEAVLDMPEPLARALAVEWASGAPFFSAYRGDRGPLPSDPILGPWNYKDVVRRACERAKIPIVSAIDMRRTCATWLVEAGVAHDEARRWFGHATRSRMLEEVYARVSPERMARAARALDFADGADEVPALAAVGGTLLRLPALSSAAERPLYTGRVGGSIPSARTIDVADLSERAAASILCDATVTEPDQIRGLGRAEVAEKTGERVRVKNPRATSQASGNKRVTGSDVTSCDSPVTELGSGTPGPKGGKTGSARVRSQTGSRYCRRCAGWYSGSTLAHRKDCAKR